MQATQKKAVDKGAVWLSVCCSAEGKQGHMAAADGTKRSPTEVGLHRGAD